jgi:hypothetical protein
MAPQVVAHPGARTTKGRFMATQKSSAPHAHPSTDDHDDTVEAHYASLEREPEACLCYDGWVYLGRVVESQHDLDGEVVEYERVPCRRCQLR